MLYIVLRITSQQRGKYLGWFLVGPFIEELRSLLVNEIVVPISQRKSVDPIFGLCEDPQLLIHETSILDLMKHLIDHVSFESELRSLIIIRCGVRVQQRINLAARLSTSKLNTVTLNIGRFGSGMNSVLKQCADGGMYWSVTGSLIAILTLTVRQSSSLKVVTNMGLIYIHIYIYI